MHAVRVLTTKEEEVYLVWGTMVSEQVCQVPDVSWTLKMRMSSRLEGTMRAEMQDKDS